MAFSQWIPVIAAAVGAAGSMAGRASANRASGRAAEADMTMQRDRDIAGRHATQQNALLQAALMAENARLNRARLGLEAPAVRARQAAGGNVLQNLRDVSIAGVPSHIRVPTISGGLRPSAIGAEGRQAGGALASQALQALLSGSDIPAQPDFGAAVLPMPDLTPLPQAGKTDRLLNILAAIGAIAEGGSTIASQIPRRKQDDLQL